VTTIDLPEGIYRGIAVNKNGSLLFVSSYSGRTVMKFSGSPETGYTADPSFNFVLSPDDTLPAWNDFHPVKQRVGPLGLAYMDEPGLLFAATDTFQFAYGGGIGSSYGRIYVIHPLTGAPVDTIDQAKWNLEVGGGYEDRFGYLNSGYTTTYDVDVDKFNDLDKAVYSQSYYGWNVERWIFDGSLGVLVSVKRIEEGTLPSTFALHQNYPNPFNPTTTIAFDVKENSHVTLALYDVLGREVAKLVDKSMPPGSYTVRFDASQLAGGIYFYRLKAGNFSETKKMVLAR